MAGAPAPAAPMRLAAAPEAVRPAATHDISQVPIADVTQRKAAAGVAGAAYRAPNRTGMPDRLKAGVEALSGLSLDRVRVHYNSNQPAQLYAHAYAEGTDIHLAPGQERHLPHEAWHVVQQAQGRVRPTAQMASGVHINDDPHLEAEADRRQTELGTLNPRPAGIDLVTAAEPASPGVVQRNVMVGTQEYKAYDRTGHTPRDLTRAVQAAKPATVHMRMSWQTDLREEAKDTTATYTYADFNEIFDTFASVSSGDKRKAQVAEQDRTISGLPPIDARAKKRARTIAYESEKAFESVHKHIRSTDEYKDTKTELEALPAGPMGKDEVQETDNAAIMLEALGHANMKRLDFDFKGTSVITHGFESMGDRTKDASTMRPFGFGPIKIGDDVGTYRKILKRNRDIRGRDNKTLRDLEMRRLRRQAAMTALKRDLYEQNQTTLSTAMAVDSPQSSVEFLGAVSGSGLTVGQKERMQEQQTFSNFHILADAVANFPNYNIGYPTADAKPQTTPQEVSDALDEMITDKNKPSKRKFRRKLKRLIASVQQIDNYDSDSDISDYEDKHYD
jgi:hypothetical protein